MRPIRLFLATLSAIAVGLGVPASVVRGQALDNDKMTLVGDLAPWANGQFSEVAVDIGRNVGFIGSFDDGGLAVIDITDRTHPVMTDRISTVITSPAATSNSADIEATGGYLAVAHERWSDPNAGFEGISIYDLHTDPFHPTLLSRTSLPGGIHSVQIDPDVNNGRPYAYANSLGNDVAEPNAFASNKVTIVNIFTGQVVSQYAPTDIPNNLQLGCNPSPSNCVFDVFAHEGFIQKHPGSGRVLDYVSYWDAGLRIVDVTDPAHPTEVGSFDYNPVVLRSGFEGGLCCAHYAAVTPSANWIYQEDEHGIDQTGGVHILDAHSCDGTTFCHPTEVGFWHIQGHPIQAAAINGQGTGANSVNGQGIGAAHGVITRFFTWDAHNLDIQGENTLLAANYTMGIRLIDTTDKTNPVEVSFFLPNSNRDIACKEKCFFQSRETWGAMFGSDGLIYSSDFWLGFFIVKPTR